MGSSHICGGFLQILQIYFIGRCYGILAQTNMAGITVKSYFINSKPTTLNKMVPGISGSSVKPNSANNVYVHNYLELAIPIKACTNNPSQKSVDHGSPVKSSIDCQFSNQCLV